LARSLCFFTKASIASRNWSLFLKLAPLRLALQQTEHDLNLIQPTRRSRCEVELHPPCELREPVVVSLIVE
jgi:hypothetical protein